MAHHARQGISGGGGCVARFGASKSRVLEGLDQQRARDEGSQWAQKATAPPVCGLAAPDTSWTANHSPKMSQAGTGVMRTLPPA